MPIKQFIIIAVCFLSLGLHAQFYNGMQTDFEKTGYNIAHTYGNITDYLRLMFTFTKTEVI